MCHKGREDRGLAVADGRSLVFRLAHVDTEIGDAGIAGPVIF